MTSNQSPSTCVKVRMNGKTIYLEKAVQRPSVEIKPGISITLLCGIQCTRDGNPVLGAKGAELHHIIQLGDHVKVTPQVWNKTYGTLEDEEQEAR